MARSVGIAKELEFCKNLNYNNIKLNKRKNIHISGGNQNIANFFFLNCSFFKIALDGPRIFQISLQLWSELLFVYKQKSKIAEKQYLFSTKLIFFFQIACA